MLERRPCWSRTTPTRGWQWEWKGCRSGSCSNRFRALGWSWPRCRWSCLRQKKHVCRQDLQYIYNLCIWIKHFASVFRHQHWASFFGPCLQAFCQAGPQHRWLLGPNGNKRKMLLPRTQRRISSLGIEPGANNLSISNLTKFNFGHNCAI